MTSDPAQMTETLRRHWSQVFTEEAIDSGMLQRLQDEIYPQGSQDGVTSGWLAREASVWKLRKSDVAKAVQSSGNTMPGPDRIPYQAWRALRQLGIDVLFEAACALSGDDAGALLCDAADETADEGHEFNLGILRCLPKKAEGLISCWENSLVLRARGPYQSSTPTIG